MAAPASAAAGRGGGMSSDNAKGLVLAVSSSAFIGASFIVKKMGLRRAADSGVRAGYGGFSYLVEPLWWIGMISMIVGEIANFAAYAFAPAILVTPLGALSIIISAALAHAILQEKLHTFGILGCVLCVVGSITIVLHAPQERDIDSVKEVWDLATEPGYECKSSWNCLEANILWNKPIILSSDLGLCTNCSYLCVEALDTFNTAVVSPIYYVMFTSLTIIASVIMFKDWDHQNPTQIVTEMCGFMTILSGTFLLHKTKDMTDSPGQCLSTRRPKHASQNAFAIEVMPLKCQDSIDDETLTLSLPKVENGYLKEEHLLRYKDSSIV
ncbi:probable magnesium transporter NIPA3 [Miscanthus floridulus]|uniref:probable magnesium transporter NIPA3 n=1 Tax=Miscanthus floridulus TaxID=154761 RepID=UPI0034590E4F